MKNRKEMEAVDFSELEQMIGVGEPRLVGEVLKIWLKTFPPQVEAVRRAVISRDRADLQESAHAAKSAAQQAAAFELGELIASMEEKSADEHWDAIDQFFEKIVDEEKRVRETIEGYLERNNLLDRR